MRLLDMLRFAGFFVEHGEAVCGCVGRGVYFARQYHYPQQINTDERNIRCNETATLSGSGLEILCNPS